MCVLPRQWHAASRIVKPVLAAIRCWLSSRLQTRISILTTVFLTADGAEVEQCGNGARCLARFVHDRRLTGKNPIRVKTANRVIELEIRDKNLVSVDMGIPELEPAKIPFEATEQALLYRY